MFANRFHDRQVSVIVPTQDSFFVCKLPFLAHFQKETVNFDMIFKLIVLARQARDQASIRLGRNPTQLIFKLRSHRSFRNDVLNVTAQIRAKADCV